jgi:hypothetical protein
MFRFNYHHQGVHYLGLLKLCCCFLGVTTLWLYFSQPRSGFQPPNSQGFLIKYNDAPQSVGLPWTSDQSVAEAST